MQEASQVKWPRTGASPAGGSSDEAPVSIPLIMRETGRSPCHQWRPTSPAVSACRPGTAPSPQFGCLDVSDAKRPGSLETENGWLERLLADLWIEDEVTCDVPKTKSWPPASSGRPYRTATELLRSSRTIPGRADSFSRWSRASLAIDVRV